jgi:hypothetical protein
MPRRKAVNLDLLFYTTCKNNHLAWAESIFDLPLLLIMEANGSVYGHDSQYEEEDEFNMTIYIVLRRKTLTKKRSTVLIISLQNNVCSVLFGQIPAQLLMIGRAYLPRYDSRFPDKDFD